MSEFGSRPRGFKRALLAVVICIASVAAATDAGKPPMRLLWVRPPSNGTVVRSSVPVASGRPLVMGDTVAAGDGQGALRLYDRYSGRPIRTVTEVTAVDRCLTLYEQQILACSRTGGVALLSADGTLTKQYDTNEPLTGIAYARDGLALLMSSRKKLVALELSTGAVRWDLVGGTVSTERLRLGAGIVATADSGIAYVGFTDEQLVAVRLESGAPVWQRSIDLNLRDLLAEPLLMERYVVVWGSVDSSEVFDRKTGDFVALVPVGRLSGEVATDTNGLIWSATAKGELIAMDETARIVKTVSVTSSGLYGPVAVSIDRNTSKWAAVTTDGRILLMDVGEPASARMLYDVHSDNYTSLTADPDIAGFYFNSVGGWLYSFGNPAF